MSSDSVVDIPYLLPQMSSAENGSADNYANDLLEDMLLRGQTIYYGYAQTVLRNQKAMPQGVTLLARAMAEQHSTRGVAIGRAMVAILPGLNRLHHGGSHTSVMGGVLPMPSCFHKGGLIVASSASGQTKPVLDAMQTSKAHNPDNIQVLGFAQYEASTMFQELCDVFIAVHVPKLEHPRPIFALADCCEMIIAEVFDAMVQQAGRRLGYTEEDWRLFHDDVWTGPYAPRALTLLNKQ